MITKSIEIDRRPEEVFAYVDDLGRHGEWQDEILSTKVETDGPVGVGTQVQERRRLGGREMDANYEITEHDPPRRTAFRGTTGSVRPVGAVNVEPVGDGSTSRVIFEFDLVGYGMGKLIAPMARRQSVQIIEANQQKLKERLESGADSAG
jgi:uncharacterized membrane protein